MTPNTTTYQGVDANLGWLIATGVAWLLAMLAAIRVAQSLGPNVGHGLISIVAILLMCLSVVTLLLPLRRFTASIDEREFRFSRRSAAAWLLRRPPTSAVVPISDINWVRLNRSPWGDGAVEIQSTKAHIRLPLARTNKRALAFEEALKATTFGNPKAKVELKPNWWVTSAGRVSTLALALIGLILAASPFLLPGKIEKPGVFVLGGLLLFGAAIRSLLTK